MNLTIFEKPEPLGTYLLGIVEDVDRHQFDQCVPVLQEQGFTVKRVIQQDGVLPIFEVDSKVILEGMYPNAEQLSQLLNLDISVFDAVKKNDALNIAAQDTRISACCGVGTDIYLDPYEDEE